MMDVDYWVKMIFFSSDVLERPTESVDDMLLKLRVLQFLSRINEGDKLSELFVFITLIE